MRVRWSLLVVVPLVACSSSSSSTPNPPYWGEIDWTAMHDRPRLSAPIVTDTPCHIVIDTPPLLVRTHVPYGTTVLYDSDPASSGMHYPFWLAYLSYQQDIDPRYYVHNLEHGAVVLMYQCAAGADCSQQRQQMEAFVTAIPDDPRCASTGTRVRAVVAPSATIATAVAAAAWGWTYSADCFDAESLGAFESAHYDDAPEFNCSEGEDPFE
jgi:hypothetical protein